jgi:hypothetical protein
MSTIVTQKRFFGLKIYHLAAQALSKCDHNIDPSFF